MLHLITWTLCCLFCILIIYTTRIECWWRFSYIGVVMIVCLVGAVLPILTVCETCNVHICIGMLHWYIECNYVFMVLSKLIYPFCLFLCSYSCIFKFIVRVIISISCQSSYLLWVLDPTSLLGLLTQCILFSCMARIWFLLSSLYVQSYASMQCKGKTHLYQFLSLFFLRVFFVSDCDCQIDKSEQLLRFFFLMCIFNKEIYTRNCTSIKLHYSLPI